MGEPNDEALRVPRLLRLEEWVTWIAPSITGLPRKTVFTAAQLEVVADALSRPADQVGGQLLYPTPAEQAAALIGGVLRGGGVLRPHSQELAVGTAGVYLDRNDCHLEIPREKASEFTRLLRATAQSREAEGDLARFLDRYMIKPVLQRRPEGREKLLVYISIPERIEDREELHRLNKVIDEAVTAAGESLSLPVELATTCPGVLPRKPEEDWEIRRQMLHGDRRVLWGGRTHWASGMIALALDGNGIVTGLEMAHLGRRCPVLVLQPARGSFPSALEGYACCGGSVYLREFSTDEDIVQCVTEFVEVKAVTMLESARERRDAVLASMPRQLSLRHALMSLSPEELTLLLARTKFRASYAQQLATEPNEFVRAERGDLHKIANVLELDVAELAVPQAPPRLTPKQKRALRITVRDRGLSGEEALRLQEQGEELVAQSQGSSSLAAPEGWEGLLEAA